MSYSEYYGRSVSIVSITKPTYLTRGIMTSQSEWVLNLYGCFRCFRKTLWLYISPLTARANEPSSLTRGCAPVSSLNQHTISDFEQGDEPTNTDNAQSFVSKNFKIWSVPFVSRLIDLHLLVLFATKLPPETGEHPDFNLKWGSDLLTPIRSPMAHTVIFSYVTHDESFIGKRTLLPCATLLA